MAAGFSKHIPHTNTGNSTPHWRVVLALTIILAVATLAAHYPAIHAGYTWDDDVFLTRSPLVTSSDGLYKAWFTKEGSDYWPLLSTMFWFEWRIWGNNPMPYHAGNIVLHGVAAILLWRVLLRLKLSSLGAFLAALIFAVHPVTVESVAWIAERKNVLSMSLYLLSILAYLRFEDRDRLRWYALALALGLAALLAKSSIVVLPLVLLLLAWWRRGQLARKDLLGSLPFFGMSLALGLVEMWFVRHQALQDVIGRPEGIASRIAATGWIVWFYLYKIALPIGLAMVYPRWDIDGGCILNYIPLALLMACFTVLWLFRKGWGRAPLAATGYFVIALLPVAGLLNMQFNRYSLVADHLQYLAMPGIFALAGGGLAAAWVWLRQHHRSGLAAGFAALAGIILIALGMLTWRQAQVYCDELELWSQTLAVNGRCWVAYNHRGNAHDAKRDYERAIQDYTMAIELKSNFDVAYTNRGNSYGRMGDYDRQIQDYTNAIELDPRIVDTYLNRAIAYGRKRDYDKVILDCNKAIELDPNRPEPYCSRAHAYGRKHYYDREISDYTRAIELRPNYAKAYNNRGSAYASKGEYARALQDFNKAIESNPDYAEAYINRAVNYYSIKAYDQAWAEVKKCRQLGRPPHPDFLRALAKVSGRSE